MSVQVFLSSGDTFYVDEELIAVLGHLEGERDGHFVMVGGRAVNPLQVAQVVFVPEVPSVEVPETIETSETLEDEE